MMAAFLRFGLEPMAYINQVRNEHAKQDMKRRFQEYMLRSDAVDKFGQIIERYYFILFATAWSPDCHPIISALAKLSVSVGSNNLVFRVIDFDNHRDLAEELNVQRVPTIVVYNDKWRELGRFTVKPRQFGTVEEELLSFIEGGK